MKKQQKKKRPYKPAGLRKPPRDPIAREVAAILADLTPREISDKSWISVSAVRNIFSGKTLKPQNLTIEGMLHAAGYHRTIVRRK